MSEFEKKWYDLYLRNMVTVETLNKLVVSGKLSKEDVESWVVERLKKHAY